jgi:hypothetical protein
MKKITKDNDLYLIVNEHDDSEHTAKKMYLKSVDCCGECDFWYTKCIGLGKIEFRCIFTNEIVDRNNMNKIHKNCYLKDYPNQYNEVTEWKIM